MSERVVPDEVTELARARQRARVEHDWAQADRLKSEIEDAGWRVVDRGTDFRLEPAAPPDVVVEGVVRHGSSQSVPSLLGQPPTTDATVVVAATDAGRDWARTIDGLRKHVPAGTQVVAVTIPGVDPVGSAAQTAWLEVVPLAGRARPGTALNAGLRRATGEVVIIVAGGALPVGDLVTPLVGALADPGVAAVGGWGSTTPDLRRFESAPAGDVDVLDPTCLAFRRADLAERGPLEERFLTAESLAMWWSLVLRDEGEERPPRRALALAGLPLQRAEPDEPDEPDGSRDAARSGAARDRRVKRDRYRILDRFGWRRDLTGGR